MEQDTYQSPQPNRNYRGTSNYSAVSMILNLVKYSDYISVDIFMLYPGFYKPFEDMENIFKALPVQCFIMR